MKPFIFVTGTQRSGTTLLCRILSSHPEIFILNESISQSELDNILPLSEAPELFCNYFKKNKINVDKKNWGFKDPYLTNHLENLYRNFPESKIIITLRDGRAVGNSYLKTKWGVANIYYGAKRWRKEVTIQKSFLNKYPHEVYLLKYESLILNTEEEIKKICDYLKIEFNNEMLEYYKKPLEFAENKSNINTKKAIDPGIMMKWRDQLSEFQINVFEAIAGDVLKENGYDLIGTPIKISPLMKHYFNIHQAIIGELQLQYQWRIKSKIRSLFNK